MPAHRTSSCASSSSSIPAAAPTPRRHSPYIPPPPRLSSLPLDSALSSIGAIYIPWGEGEKDPVPPCSAVDARKSLARRFGEEALGGWTTAPPFAPRPQPAPRKPQLPLSLAGIALPPLPPLPALPPSSRSKQHPLSNSGDIAVSPLESASSLPTFSFSPASPLPSSSSPSSSSVSSSSLVTPPSDTWSDPPSLLVDHPAPELPYLSDALLPFSSSSFTDLSLSLSLPEPTPEPTPEPVPADLPTGFIPQLPVLKEEDEDQPDEDEYLWSAGEDGGLLFTGTDAESEASWGSW
ncbi:hypothetical protein JCM10213_009018 [Rhodosporidiobolus nylandii]